MQMVMTSDETQIQILAHWPMSHAKRVTRDNRKKSRISCRCRDKETADRQKLSRREIMAKPCKKWAACRIWKDLRPQKYWKKIMQRTANENAACIRRICKRSDQPKVERITNNDARMILLLIRSFTAFSFAVLCIIFFHYIRDFPRDHCARNMSEEKSTTCQGILPLRVLLRSPPGSFVFYIAFAFAICLVVITCIFCCN